MAKPAAKHSLVQMTRQSPPLESPSTVDDSWLKNKTILITGGASGFGAGFVTRWAAAGATIVFGDVNVTKGMRLAKEAKESTGNPSVHFIKCDVTDWSSQVNLFKEAVKLSPHGGIDTVVANAGIADSTLQFENPKDLDAADPPPPSLAVLNVNLIGVVYTTHLALYYLPRNPGAAAASPDCDPRQTHRDRHLLLIGSVASFVFLPGQAQYGAAKHGVLGLYRCLRSSVLQHGVRVNLMCPYFIDTPLLSVNARFILAGGTLGIIDDVVEAATRFTSDPRIVGRAVSVGPKLKVTQDERGEWSLSEGGHGEEKAIWEIYAHDFEDSDIFQRRMIGILNRAVEIRAWTGWAGDMIGAASYAVRAWWNR
ncbi:MAG: hypothetical protein Q9187_003303 [Circinaria calcarea]